MVTEAERILHLESVPDEGLEARVSRLERTLALLLSDKAISNVLKGPLRLPGHAKTSAFQ